ncbi:MAG: XRE family transcriptional regulator [Bacteroidales bacterium]|nr:XRE family transcriptional regulator [Bacteroidales bacterium]
MNEAPHIGNLIKAELARQQRSVTWLARQMGCSRQNLCRQLDHSYLGTDQLLKISLILHRDFFQCFTKYISNQF